MNARVEKKHEDEQELIQRKEIKLDKAIMNQ